MKIKNVFLISIIILTITLPKFWAMEDREPTPPIKESRSLDVFGEYHGSAAKKDIPMRHSVDATADVAPHKKADRRKSFTDDVLDQKRTDRYPVVSRKATFISHRDECPNQILPVAALFCDIRDFTEMSELNTDNPESIMKLLNALYGDIGTIARKHAGEINLYIGDAIFIVFPVGSEHIKTNRDACLHAVQCALEIIDLTYKFTHKPHHPLRMNHPIRCGIGLDFGTVVSGLLGHVAMRQKTYIGSTINRASRLESVNKEPAIKTQLLNLIGETNPHTVISSMVISGNVYDNLPETISLDPTVATMGRKTPPPSHQDIQKESFIPSIVSVKGVDGPLSIYAFTFAPAKEEGAAASAGPSETQTDEAEK